MGLRSFRSLCGSPQKRVDINKQNKVIAFPRCGRGGEEVPRPAIRLASIRVGGASRVKINGRRGVDLSPCREGIGLFFSAFSRLGASGMECTCHCGREGSG